MKRWMALDIGEKRIGVAVSDPSGTIAQGVAVITRTGKQNKDLRRLVELFQEYQCTGLVIGLPLHMNGRAGEEAEKIKEFGVLLGEKCGVTLFSGMNVSPRFRRSGPFCKWIFPAAGGGR